MPLPTREFMGNRSTTQDDPQLDRIELYGKNDVSLREKSLQRSTFQELSRAFSQTLSHCLALFRREPLRSYMRRRIPARRVSLRLVQVKTLIHVNNRTGSKTRVNFKPRSGFLSH